MRNDKEPNKRLSRFLNRGEPENVSLGRYALCLPRAMLALPVEDAAARCPVGGNHRTGARDQKPFRVMLISEIENLPKIARQKMADKP